MRRRRNCVHRFVQARYRGKGRWRVYCTACGKWMRTIKATGPDLDAVSGGTFSVSEIISIP